MAQDQERVLDLFEQASALPQDRRAAFLDGACGDDATMREEVKSLLAAQDSAGDFLGAITIDDARTKTEVPPAATAIGTRIGRYRLASLLGEGGFGSVYHARQEAPVRRDVAVKIIKPGMDSRQVIARFEAERQALAILDHPHIARVYDAGTTEAGRPYFVMEYVPGKPITQFCDDNRLSIHERLLLFVQACEAIAHAHTKAIIHRDVKASNVLAYMHDGKPTVTVIDFGIAKALRGDRLTDASFNTEQGLVIGTYESMSPEQAEGSADIDTRTDVYSLGVLLYELLAGTKPFDHETLAVAAEQEIRRIICEVEPPRPSTRLSSLGDAGVRIAQLRQSRQDTLAKQLRSELEWIPLKAMRKERARRYASPQQLIEDIQNYLDGQPLIAGPESRTYRASKFLRRNARGATLTVAVALSIVIVSVLYLRGMRAEQRRTQAALNEASNQRDIARAVSSFLTEHVLAGATPERLPDNSIREGVVKAMLNPAAEAVAKDFRDKPLTEAAVRSTLATSYRSLGRDDLGLPHAERALALRRQILGEDDPDTLGSINDVGALLLAMGKIRDAEPLYRQALSGFRRVLGDMHPDTLSTMCNLGHLLHEKGEFAEAEPLLREALERRRRVLGENDPGTMESLNNLGALLLDERKLEEAEPLYREALERYRRVLGDNNPRTMGSMNNMAYLLAKRGKLESAETLYREALERRRRVLGNDNPDTLYSINNYASLLEDEGKLTLAEPLFRESLAGFRRWLGNEHRITVAAISNLGGLLQHSGKLNEAQPLLQEALARRRQLFGEEDPDTLVSKNNLATLLLAQNQPDQAAPLLCEALTAAANSPRLGRTHPKTTQFAANYARCLDAMGRHEEATTTRNQFNVPEPATKATTNQSLGSSTSPR
jgi:serine/threonine protein kinase/Tfp pilus assembly protein PilF